MFNGSIEQLTNLNAVERLSECDASLFTSDPVVADAIASRLGWVDLASDTDEVVELLHSLRIEASDRGIKDVVLLGMGGSSLASLVINSVLLSDSSEQSPRLHVLDTTCPEDVARVIGKINFRTTFIIVASKSGDTIEPLSLGDLFFELAAGELGHEHAASHFIAITDSGSALSEAATAQNWRHVIHARATVGGRFSALSVFGLVPMALCGLDFERLIESAYRMEMACRNEEAYANPAAQLGSFLSDAYVEGRDKLMLIFPERYATVGLWLEQLVAESVGKEGHGIVPIITDATRMGTAIGSDQLVVVLREDDDTELGAYVDVIDPLGPVREYVIGNAHDIGGEFVRWEFAIALLGVLMGVNPFDQPDVGRAKQATSECLADSNLACQIETRPLSSLSSCIQSGDYIALLAYLPTTSQSTASLTQLTSALEERYRMPVSVSRGPRYLHSTGQLHKGGANNGMFIVIGANAGGRADASQPNGASRPSRIDISLPHARFTLRELYNAQRCGDIASLTQCGRRVFTADSVDAVLAEL